MVKKTITYEDYDGNPRTRDFYFHMNQTEFSKLNGEIPGGFDGWKRRIINNQDENELLKLIDMVLSHSYGEFDEENEFTKIGKNGRPLYERFINTEAYDKLMISMLKDDKSFTEFVLDTLPKAARADVEKQWRESQEVNRLTPVDGGTAGATPVLTPVI